MQSARFGVAWIVHQTVPRLLVLDGGGSGGDREKDIDRESALIVAYALGSVMPCRYCRDSYRQFSRAAHIDRLVGGTNKGDQKTLRRTDHERYWTTVHNMVNAKLKKPVIDQADPLAVKRAYETSVASTPCRFVDALLEWLQMIALNYDVPIDTPAKVDAVWRIRRAASCAANRGFFLDESRRRAVPLPAVIEAYALAQKPRTQKQQSKRRFGAETNETMTDAEWLKVAWYVFYIAHLVSIMSRSQHEQLRRCAAALSESLYLDGAESCSSSNNDDDKKEPFQNADTLFAALHRARASCLPATCHANGAVERAVYETCRANQCKDGKCF